MSEEIKEEVKFQVVSKYKPAGDQPKAIKALTEGLNNEVDTQTLLGITGSGKTFTIANVIEQTQRPTLIISHNKTLAAQLYNEIKEFLPNNAVEYFISYYDYYQPEAYIPSSDTYIEKTASINEEIDRLRHSTTRSLYERKDVVVVASVSCIYGLGMPESYFNGTIKVAVGDTLDRDELLEHLVKVRYTRDDLDPDRANFRVKGDTVDIFPSYEEKLIRINFFADEVEKISVIDPHSGEVLEKKTSAIIFPAVHYLTEDENPKETRDLIRDELKKQLEVFRIEGKELEAQRLQQRVHHDLEMIREMGYCSGIENYSSLLERRPVGSPPATLIDYFPDDFLLVIDESHVSLPQIRAMFNGDRARKNVLVDYGFRLPCARDNRPLKFDEFYEKIGQKIFVSATPGDFELEESTEVVEQIIRPTGLLDPEVEVLPSTNQVENLMSQIKERTKKNHRVLVTTLTKRMAEDLCDYLSQNGIKVRYLHSEIVSLERIEILRDLRLGEFDVLIGVNLLREGLDLPEVSLVAIMDADKEGFLRCETSLIQTIGRAARNVDGKVLMYANRVTKSMQTALDETKRRRELQMEYNEKHGIVPQTIKKKIDSNLLVNSFRNVEDVIAEEMATKNIKRKDLPKLIEKIEKQMHKSARALDFERASQLRDKLKILKDGLE